MVVGRVLISEGDLLRDDVVMNGIFFEVAFLDHSVNERLMRSLCRFLDETRHHHVAFHVHIFP